MVYKQKTNGEFSGGAGMVQPEQIGHEDGEQQLWEVYSTNPAALDSTGSPLAENVGRQYPNEPINAADLPQTVGEMDL